MVMCLGIGDAEADRDDVEERRFGEFCAPAAEIIPGMEDELELPGAGLVSSDQRVVGATVGVGHDFGDKVAGCSVRQLVQL